MLIDKEDLGLFDEVCIHSRKEQTTDTYYASCTIDRKMKQTHRMIYEKHNGVIPAGMVIDHISGDYFGGLDNRKANLRAVSQSVNNRNIRIKSGNNTSGIIGIQHKNDKYKVSFKYMG